MGNGISLPSDAPLTLPEHLVRHLTTPSSTQVQAVQASNRKKRAPTGAIATPRAELAKIEQPSGGNITLRPFQRQMVQEVYGFIRSNYKRILIVAPCGAGKTVTASWILRDATVRAKSPMRCVFLVDLNCLLEQAAKTLRSLGVSCTIFQGNRKVDWNANVIVTSAQTLQSRYKKEGFDSILGKVGLFIGDEVHDLAYRSVYGELENHYLKTGTLFLGLTGTPYRMSKKQYLGQWFDVKVEAPQPPELIKMGLLVPCRMFGPGQVFDVTQIDIGRDGDYVESQMEAQANKKAALDAVVAKWVEMSEGRPTVAFCSGVEHAKKLTQTFVDAGIAAEWQTGQTPYGDREKQDNRLKSGETKVLCSVGTLSKGWDNPCVSCILFVRATRSLGLFIQAVTRGGRIYKGKTNFLLLDFGDNIERFGRSPTGFQDYDISPKPKRDRDEASNYKVCPGCSLLISIFSAVCPGCGFEFTLPKEEDEEDDEDIAEEINLVEIFAKDERAQVKFLRDQKRLCYREDRSPDDACDAFRQKYGFIAYREWHFAAILGKRYSNKRKQEYTEYLMRHTKNDIGFKYQYRLEFGFESESFYQQDLWKRSEAWWQVLGVEVDADYAAAKAAYLELARAYHPDVSDRAEAKAHMQIINRAWEEARSTLRSPAE